MPYLPHSRLTERIQSSDSRWARCYTWVSRIKSSTTRVFLHEFPKPRLLSSDSLLTSPVRLAPERTVPPEPAGQLSRGLTGAPGSALSLLCCCCLLRPGDQRLSALTCEPCDSQARELSFLSRFDGRSEVLPPRNGTGLPNSKKRSVGLCGRIPSPSLLSDDRLSSPKASNRVSSYLPEQYLLRIPPASRLGESTDILASPNRGEFVPWPFKEKS